MITLDNNDKKHSLISPSSFERRLLCPGSLHAEKDLPDTTSIYAEIGTMLHDRAYKALISDVRWLEDLDDEQKQAVESVAEYYKDLKKTKDVCLELLETTFSLNFLREDMKGTADAVLLIRDTATTFSLHVIDFKFGKGVAVEAYKNYQLMMYLLAVYNDKRIKSFIKNHKVQVVLHIVQPFIKNSCWYLKDDELREAINITFYETVINRAYQRKAKRTASEKACRFCKAKFTCTEFAKSTLELNNNFISKKEPEELKEDEIINIYENRNIIKLYLNALEQHMLEKIKTGAGFEDYTVITKYSNRKWRKDIDEDLKELLGERAYVTANKLITISEAKKLVNNPSVIDMLTEKEEVGLSIIKR